MGNAVYEYHADGSEAGDWTPAQDPCVLLLGSGWRMPTFTEFKTVISVPKAWGPRADAYNSALKLHAVGTFNNAGIFTNRTSLFYWSGTSIAATTGKAIYQSGSFNTNDNNKAEALPVRCIRDEITATLPSVSNVAVPVSGMTADGASTNATVSAAGTAAVTSSGIVWSTTNKIPTIADQSLASGSGTGGFTVAMTGLTEEVTYYVRAFAQNSVGIVYSPEVASFKICNPFTVIHRAGFNGAPVDKTITYKVISSNIIGDPRCWLAQNLGTTQQATAHNDVRLESAGWYWQFNRVPLCT
ncbi:hypothetical protein H9X96_01305 [Pedobacter sp. N36a]|uniref:hypothetical protein n=1 Tax=Pedobacter sp. N36a TaxID=2767996 RepID=UPI001656DE2C|nr:hypothetical protein [Pedobacter sp. N36a]MBC8984407.1 hypothetical protein [Pedobacter sp. N36a]